MLTRLWQHRYQGLLATFLLGLSAAIIVMLLPDRQQAFARFALDPVILTEIESPYASQSSDATQAIDGRDLLDDQRLISRVLQQIEIESRNPIDPRPVDPIDSFKRNFALRNVGSPNEFEVSYVGRTAEKAAQGVSAWLQAATEVLRFDPTGSSAIAANNSVVQKARQELISNQADELALTQSIASLEANVDTVRANLNSLAEQNKNNASGRAEVGSGASENAGANQAQQRLAIEPLQQALAEATKAREQAEKTLASAQAQVVLSREQQAEPGARSQTRELATVRRLDRQSNAVQRELDQLRERNVVLGQQLDDTPPTITELLTVRRPVAPVSSANDQQIAKARAELARLRVRFTDNHPDVRGQLSLLADLLPQAGATDSTVTQAPTAGARSVTRRNPNYEKLQADLSGLEVREKTLLDRVAEIGLAQKQASQQLRAVAQSASSKAQASADESQRELRQGQQALSGARAQEQKATDALAKAIADAPQAALSPAPNSSAYQTSVLINEEADRQRSQFESKFAALEQSLAQAQDDLMLVRLETANRKRVLDRELAIARAAFSEKTAALKADKKDSAAAPSELDQLSATQSAVMVIQAPLVVPATSNPDRPRWLLISLVMSLVLGALFALLISLRRTSFQSVNELEKLTGLRALGSVPRFASGTRTVGFLFSILVFAGLLLLYGLVYFALIFLVESGASLLSLDWPALQALVPSLLKNGAVQLGLDPSWLNWLNGTR